MNMCPVQICQRWPFHCPLPCHIGRNPRFLTVVLLLFGGTHPTRNRPPAEQETLESRYNRFASTRTRSQWGVSLLCFGVRAGEPPV